MEPVSVVASLIVGVTIGYLGQRSRLCFMGGVRDYVLIKDTYLIKGLLGATAAAAVGFYVAHFFAPLISMPNYPWYKYASSPSFLPYFLASGGGVSIDDPCRMPEDALAVFLGTFELHNSQELGIDLGSFFITYRLIFTIIGGLGLGVFSTLANGCPFRQHVMAGQGNRTAWSYLTGFYLGGLLYYFVIRPFIGQYIII